MRASIRFCFVLRGHGSRKLVAAMGDPAIGMLVPLKGSATANDELLVDRAAHSSPLTLVRATGCWSVGEGYASTQRSRDRIVLRRRPLVTGLEIVKVSPLFGSLSDGLATRSLCRLLLVCLASHEEKHS